MSIRWIKDGEPHSAEVYNRPLRDYIQDAETTYVKQSTRIDVGNGLNGGGSLVGDVISIEANDATTQQKGVVRFATLEEANEGTPGVVVSPDIIKSLIETSINRDTGVIYSNIGGMIVQVWKTTVYSNRFGQATSVKYPKSFPTSCIAVIPLADHANSSQYEAIEVAYSAWGNDKPPTKEDFHYYSNYTGVGVFVAIGY